MKTVMINASPKKKMSVSEHFMQLQRLFVRGTVVKEHLRTKGDTQRILETLKDADNIVFCLPLYVDGVPSHVLGFMKELEKYTLANALDCRVYVISNGGFIEGSQNKALMQVFENFCARSGFEWDGGIGIGGGVMLNVMRIMLFVFIGIFALRMVMGAAPGDALMIFAKQLGMIIFFHLGVLFYSIGMGAAINKGKSFGEKYTRAMMPSFLFILVADIFFVIISIFQGGIFRGWLSKKQICDIKQG